VPQLYLRVKYPLSAHYTGVRIKNCLKSTSVTTIKKHDGATPPAIIWNWSIHCPSLSPMFKNSSTNQELHLCNQSSHYEKIWMISVTQVNHHIQPPNQCFWLSAKKWNTKEDTGKSLKNELDILQYAKRHLSGWSDVEQWKNQARSLSCYQVMLVWRHQSVGNSVE